MYSSKISTSRGGESTKARANKNSIGTYKTRSGKIKHVKPLSPTQLKKYPIKSEIWKNIPRERLENQSRLFKGIGGFFGFWGFMIFFGMLVVYMINMSRIPSYMFLAVLFIGMFFLLVGGLAYSGGSFRRKFLVLTEESNSKTSEADINAIVEQFLSNP